MQPNPVLAFLTPLYAAGVRFRNTLYEKGFLTSYRCGVPVISVGNMTAGGTGKTPMTEYLIRLLAARGRKIAVLSRGYGRAEKAPVVVGPAAGARTVSVTALGDELTQIAQKFPGVVIAADGDRVRSANRVVKEFGVDVILLDDGFQHRRLARDLDIVLIDVTKRFVSERLLPAGYRREPISSLQRADLIGYTRADMSWTPDVKSIFDAKPGLMIRFVPKAWIDGISGERKPVPEFAGRMVFAFSGLGNPDAFHTGLTGVGVQLDKSVTFPDHHWFAGSEIEQVIANANPGSLFVTTEKDLVRLSPELRAMFPQGSLFALEIAAEIFQGEELLLSRISGLGL